MSVYDPNWTCQAQAQAPNVQFLVPAKIRGAASSAAGPHTRASGLLWMAPGVLLDWRHCGVDLVVILHHEIDIGRKFHGLGERFQF